jgi:hypothetical protein
MSMIDTPQKRRLAELRSLAARHPVDGIALQNDIKTRLGRRRHKSHVTRQTIVLPDGFVVSFTIDIGHPSGPCRHLTISMERIGGMPTPQFVATIAEELGFIDGGAHLTVEQMGPRSCVVMIQPLAIHAEGHA